MHHVRSDGGDVAWTAVGTGPTIVLGGWWSSHLAHDWEDARFRRFVDRLAEHRRVVRYDPPGAGLSRRSGGIPDDLAGQIEPLVAVIGAAADGPVSLVAGSSGCPVAVALAATHPELVDRLVLYGGYRSGADVAAPSAQDAIVDLVRRNWGLSTRVLSEIFLPEASAEERREFTRHQRRSASADEAAAAIAAVYALDASEFVARVTAPTLVLHRRDDRAIRAALGRDLADSIPGAQFQLLDGGDHFPWAGDQDAVVTAILTFIGVSTPSPAAPQRTRSASGVGALTVREIEILVLVSEGLTDAQIAERLFLSPHTVHRHVANARGKLGASTRAAAATLVATAAQR